MIPSRTNAGRAPWQRKRDPVVEAAPAPAPEKLSFDRLRGRLFGKTLPVDAGGPPEGLANDSAQGCAACHPNAVDRWREGPHATPPTAALLDAAIGLPACTSCHLPLAAQHEAQYRYPGGRLDRAESTPNPAFRATLVNEGVTCASCHLRDEAIVVATEVAAAAAAPHRMVFSDTLSSSEACAACHQLSWPGAHDPLYDTYGEWKRSGFAAIGISCQGCHMLGAADGSIGADHRVAVDPARAVSVLLEAPTLSLVRGADPVDATLTLQNTGAGHAFPTGTPFRGVRLDVALVRPADPGGDPFRVGLTEAQLHRDFDPAPPFSIVGDTRLQAGESRDYRLAIALPADAPAENWRLVVRLVRTLRGEPTRTILVERSWELAVE